MWSYWKPWWSVWTQIVYLCNWPWHFLSLLSIWLSIAHPICFLISSSVQHLARIHPSSSPYCTSSNRQTSTKVDSGLKTRPPRTTVILYVFPHPLLCHLPQRLKIPEQTITDNYTTDRFLVKNYGKYSLTKTLLGFAAWRWLMISVAFLSVGVALPVPVSSPSVTTQKDYASRNPCFYIFVFNIHSGTATIHHRVQIFMSRRVQPCSGCVSVTSRDERWRIRRCPSRWCSKSRTGKRKTQWIGAERGSRNEKPVCF